MKSVFQRLSVRWPEYLIESLVIIASILGAFALDRWNENVSNENKRIALLHSLKSEYEANYEIIQYALWYHGQLRTAAYDWKSIIGTDITHIENDSLNRRFVPIHFTYTLNSNGGALRSGISSGEIHLIQNDSLLYLLFGWEDILADMKEDELLGYDLTIKARTDLFSKHIRISDQGQMARSKIGPSKFPSNYQSLIDDPFFEDYLTMRLIYVEDVFEEMNILEQSNKDILRLIDVELSK